MIDITKAYRTRDGREVRIYSTDGHGRFSVHGAIKHEFGWQSAVWNAEGACWLVTSKNKTVSIQASDDLIEVKPRIQRTLWLNFYRSTECPRVYWHKAQADMDAPSHRIACVKIEIDVEEGESL